MTPLILHIDTATQVCSVALSRGAENIAYRESREKNAHSKNVTLFVEEVISESGLAKDELDAISVSMGPGSYTGLRIGVSTAKGLCYALEKPLIAISTLQAMAYGLAEERKEKVLYCPMIDARRMEVYTALFDENNRQLREIRAEIIDENSFSEFLNNQKIYFFGDGAPKCKEVLGDQPNAVFIDDFFPSAKFMSGIALDKFQNNDFVDVAYFEPFYLKDFIAGKPKVKGLD